MNNIPDVLMTGESTTNQFGYSVSSAGDINGDGYSDVIAGAYGYSSNSGKTYIYTGSAISVKPVILHVKDIPNDQGGMVNLKWSKSMHEAYGYGNITNYLVYRSVPPGLTGYQWVQIADIAAVNFPFYYYDANTLNDSSAGSNGNTYFLIKARNGNTGEIWNSNILSGRSIDNLAPAMVQMFSAEQISNDIKLNWKRNTEPDLLNYIIYRNNIPEINPETAVPLTSLTDSLYLDVNPPAGLKFYFIAAQDIHNNKSVIAMTDAPNLTVNLTMYIEGFYNAGTNSQVSDTLKTYLRNSFSPYNIVDESNALVTSSGNSVLKFGNAVSGNYFLMITHRNSIETWSAGGISMTVGIPVNYNLSSSSSQAYGSNQIQVDTSPVRFGIYSGDVNQDGVIDIADGSLIDNDAFNFESGYLATDVNGDGVIDLADAVFADNNGFNFVGKITP